MKLHLVRVIVSQTTAQVGVAPGKGLTPRRGDQNFILLYSQYAFVRAHDLSHGLLELWKKSNNTKCGSVTQTGIQASLWECCRMSWSNLVKSRDVYKELRPLCFNADAQT